MQVLPYSSFKGMTLEGCFKLIIWKGGILLIFFISVRQKTSLGLSCIVALNFLKIKNHLYHALQFPKVQGCVNPAFFVVLVNQTKNSQRTPIMDELNYMS